MAIISDGPDTRSHAFLQGFSGVVGVRHKGIISDIINHFLLGRVELNVVTATRGRLDGCIFENSFLNDLLFISLSR
jgi:hypothetical protein